MAAAQAGVVFPADSREPGWAWAGIGDSLEAYALSDFVKGAMDSVAAQQQEASDAAGAANLDTVESYDPLAERVRDNPEAAAELEKLRRVQQEEMLQQGTVGGREVGSWVLAVSGHQVTVIYVQQHGAWAGSMSPHGPGICCT
jgi:hypothetical protein